MIDIFDGKQFESLKDVSEYVRAKIRTFHKPTYIGEEHGDFEFFKELYLRYNKNYGGIQAFLLDHNPKYRNKYVDYLSVCLNGHWICFSWVNCCKKRSKSFNERLSDAMRREIEDEIYDFRSQFCPSCAVCGVIENCEVDHIREFSTIRDEYLAISGKPTIEFNDNEIGVVLPEGEFRDGWKKYHKQNATYQYLCKFHHKKKTAKFCGYNI